MAEYRSSHRNNVTAGEDCDEETGHGDPAGCRELCSLLLIYAACLLGTCCCEDLKFRRTLPVLSVINQSDLQLFRSSTCSKWGVQLMDHRGYPHLHAQPEARTYRLNAYLTQLCSSRSLIYWTLTCSANTLRYVLCFLNSAVTFNRFNVAFYHCHCSSCSIHNLLSRSLSLPLLSLLAHLTILSLSHSGSTCTAHQTISAGPSLRTCSRYSAPRPPQCRGW